MRSLLQYLIFTILLTTIHLPALYGQCTDCEVMVCDGVNCDDGSSADGVQTSRKCGCGSEIGGACAYVDVDMTLNPFFNPGDPSCSLIFNTQEQGNFYIYFTDANCTVADCNDPNYIVSGGSTISSFPSSGTFSVMVCKEGGNAGRRDFSFTVSCTAVENCLNQIDDDLDGFVDCDDSDCSLDANCSFTSTSSSNDGGLESNDRLAQKIARRNFLRTRSNADQTSIRSQKNLFVNQWSAKQVNEKSGALQLSDFIPDAAISGSQTYISSPKDLIAITNALDVFAVDVFREEKRVASVFATTSENGVYEHTKFICDRLHGARIEQIWEHPIDGAHPFIVTKFTRPDGITEYACNFSFFQPQDRIFQLESHWNIADYTPEKSYANFQIWANNLLNLELLTREILTRIEEQAVELVYNFTEAPEVFVQGLTYEKGILDLDIMNKAGATQLDLRGEYTVTETMGAQPFQATAQLNGARQDQVQLQTDGVYNMGLSLYHDQTRIADGVFVSDGAWGVDYQVGGAMIYDYEITPGSYSDARADEYAVERNLLLRGTLKDYVAAYRALNPAFRPVYLDNFNTLTFKARGTGDLEITIVKEGISDWEQQMKTAVRLTDDLQEIVLSKDRFYAPDGAVDWSDVKMIVLSLRGDQENGQSFALEVEDMVFSHQELPADPVLATGQQSKVFPNPLVTTSALLFQTYQTQDYVFQLLTLNGVVLQEKRGYTTAGINELAITNQGYTPGIYIYTVALSNGEVISGKILIEK